MSVRTARAVVPSHHPVPVGELIDAWWAVQRGEFRRSAASRGQAPRSVATAWRPAPGEVPILVTGCGGSVGASTVALLLASAAPRSRVVECSPRACSGLAGASTAELGEAEAGWLCGTRGEVRIQRRSDDFESPDALPAPVEGVPGGVTIVDCWWELRQTLASPGWLGNLARECERVVLVARATVPGMQRLESSLSMLRPDRCWPVITGASARRLPRPVGHAMGPLTRQLVRGGRLHCLPDNPVLALSGITTEPLPRSYAPAAARLLEGLLK